MEVVGSQTHLTTFAGFGTFSGPRGAQAAAAPPRSRRAAALPASRGRRSTRAACRRPGRRRHGHGGRDHPHRQEDGQDGAEEERGERRDGTGREADRRRCRRPRRGPGRRRAPSFPRARGLSLPAAALPALPAASALPSPPRGAAAPPRAPLEEGTRQPVLLPRGATTPPSLQRLGPGGGSRPGTGPGWERLRPRFLLAGTTVLALAGKGNLSPSGTLRRRPLVSPVQEVLSLLGVRAAVLGGV